jgi:hypothetical protein
LLTSLTFTHQNAEYRSCNKSSGDGCEVIDIITSTRNNFNQLIEMNVSSWSLNNIQSSKNLAESFHSLRKLVLSGCSLSDDSLIAISQGCKEMLDYLDIGNNKEVTDRGVVAIAEECVKLTHLSMHGCGKVTSVSLLSISNKLKLLIFLNLRELRLLSDRGLMAISKGCHELKTINLNCFPTKVTCAGIDAIVDCCAKLEVIIIWHRSNGSSGPVSIHFTKDCPNLKSISLSRCDNTDKSLIALAEHCTNLLRICISSSVNVTDCGVEAIVKGCQQLTHLSVGNCKLITDKSLFHIAAHCSCLLHLDLNYCSLLTDTGLSAILVRCGLLKFLGVSACALLTDHTLIEIGTNCSKLTFLDVRHCNFTQMEVANTKKQLPKLFLCCCLVSLK